jgi:diguanylate cyclase (GGDEF)-like protein
VFWVVVLSGLAYLTTGLTVVIRGAPDQLSLFIVAASRVLAWLFAVGTAILVRRQSRERVVIVSLIIYLVSVGLGESLELWFIPVAVLGALPITGLMVLTFYVVNPLYLTVSLIGGGLTTVGYLLSVGLALQLAPVDYIDIIVTMILMNGIGAYFQLTLLVRRRREFVTLTDLRDRNDELRSEIDRRISLEGKLRVLAETDSLTGIYNRRYFTSTAEREVKRCLRYGHKLSFIILDIDRFKRINDRYGHSSGDDVLVNTVNVLKECLREVDTVARVGGEEFAVLLPDTELEGARQVAERIRSTVASAKQPIPLSRSGVTVSLGVAELLASDSDFDSLYRRGDRALYTAKDRGRNRVAVLSE